ncbi:hypothetical protein T09_6166 [Trichinella sp. T9]|nr:hypothetical protein T09_6166 [Trichinella sp. T9]
MKIDRLRRKENPLGCAPPQQSIKGLLYYKNKLQIAGFISFSIAQIKIAKYVTFLSISHQIRFCTTSDQGSSTSGTPLKRIDNVAYRCMTEFSSVSAEPQQ